MIKISYQGIEITVSSTAEAVSVARELAALPTSTPKASATWPVSNRPITARRQLNAAAKADLFKPPSEYQKIAAFLKVLIKAGEAGITADSIMPIFGTEDARGLGGRMARSNTVLDGFGFNKEDVYNNEVRGAEGRIWRAGPRAKDALAALEASE